MSMNLTSIGCLAKTGQDQQLKFIPQSHISFYDVFFEKKHGKPLRQTSVTAIF